MGQSWVRVKKETRRVRRVCSCIYRAPTIAEALRQDLVNKGEKSTVLHGAYYGMWDEHAQILLTLTRLIVSDLAPRPCAVFGHK